MRHVGSPSEWISLLDSLVPDILALVIASWRKLLPLAGNATEDSTSENLCRCLRKQRDRCALPFNIYPQLVELDPSAGEDQGRMDIVFAPMVPREYIYFCVECKRLNVAHDGQIRPYSSEYVRFGMLRFVNGQYAAKVRNGAMLGFVLDGDIASAIANVSANIQQRHVELGMEPPGAFKASTIVPRDSGVQETHHRRPHNWKPFVIHHIFLAGTIRKSRARRIRRA